MDVLLLSPVCPSPATDGHRLAVESDINALTDNRCSVGLLYYYYGEAQHRGVPFVPSEGIRARTGGFADRFRRGIFSKFPPSIERFYHEDARDALSRCISKWNPKIIVIDDLTLGGWLPLIRERTHAIVVLRTHNVMTDVRREHLSRSSWHLRAALRVEALRYASLEKTCLEGVDAHWAITESDRVRMQELYPNSHSFHLPVSIDLPRYKIDDSSYGGTDSFTHVGTIDYRRRADFESFLKGTWAEIEKAAPASVLYLAGKIHGKYKFPASVKALGQIEDERNIYRLGQYSINFQRSTGGIKLKSLTSMAAGRTLLSYRAGVEGMEVVPNVHYLPLENIAEAAGVGRIIVAPEKAREIAEAGREWVTSKHSRRRVASAMSSLVASLIGEHTRAETSQPRRETGSLR